MENNICYGRLSPIKNALWYRRNGNPNIVNVSWWIADCRPFYANGSYLEFWAEETEHRIYNPLKLSFNINSLVSTIKTLYNKQGIECGDFKIVSVEESG